MREWFLREKGERDGNCIDPSQAFAPPEGRPNTSLPTFSPASLLLSISTPIRCVLEPSQSTLRTPPSHPPPMRVHRSLYASATRRCAREPSPSECHSSGVTQVMRVECTA